MSLTLPKTAKLAAIAALCLACPATPALAEQVQPLPASDYTVRHSCREPAPGRAACMALQLVPASPAAASREHPIGASRAIRGNLRALSPAEGGFGLRPQDLRTAYALESEGSEGQTIALVDAYNDPRAETDLATFDSEFKLPECTTANGCFRKVGQTGSEASLPFPHTTKELEEALTSKSESEEFEAEEAIGWGTEISLDIETAHAICPHCKIVLVEANTSSESDLVAAEARAEALSATEISNSWGLPDTRITPAADNGSPFNHPGTVITASSGDGGYDNWLEVQEIEEELTPEEREEFRSELEEFRHANYPAASPHVVAVGGTHLILGAGSTWAGERIWNGDGASGGGCSALLGAPVWQQEVPDWSSVGCNTRRAVADVSADADPYSGVAVADSDDPTGTQCTGEYEGRSWCTYGGTSLASPIIAAIYALAGGAGTNAYPALSLYQNLATAPQTLHDVTEGSNGICHKGFTGKGLSLCSAAESANLSCGGALSCLAAGEYDGPSGVGSPDGILAFEPGAERPHSSPGGGGGGNTAAAPSSTTVPVPPPSGPATAAQSAPQVSALSLTTLSIIALDQGRPTTGKVGFSFQLNVPARVKVTLAKQVRVHGHRRWVQFGRTMTLSAGAGANTHRLAGHLRLRAGVYRLTVAPLKGHARSLVFHIE